MTSRGEEIEAAVAVYDNANPLTSLPRSTAQLLAVMFPIGDLCQQSLDALAARGFSSRNLPGTLLSLIKAGFLDRQQGRVDTYQLNLPPVRR
jgi:hypothetical protein